MGSKISKGTYLIVLDFILSASSWFVLLQIDRDEIQVGSKKNGKIQPNSVHLILDYMSLAHINTNSNIILWCYWSNANLGPLGVCVCFVSRKNSDQDQIQTLLNLCLYPYCTVSLTWQPMTRLRVLSLGWNPQHRQWADGQHVERQLDTICGSMARLLFLAGSLLPTIHYLHYTLLLLFLYYKKL